MFVPAHCTERLVGLCRTLRFPTAGKFDHIKELK